MVKSEPLRIGGMPNDIVGAEGKVVRDSRGKLVLSAGRTANWKLPHASVEVAWARPENATIRVCDGDCIVTESDGESLIAEWT